MNIKAIRARVGKATPEPWVTERQWRLSKGDYFSPIFDTNEDYLGEMNREANSDFVAHARQDIPNLLDVLEEAMRFGGHKADCNSKKMFPYDKGRCDCGYAAFLTKHGASDE